MGAPPNPTEPPASKGCLWGAFFSVLLWFLIAIAIRKGMT